MDLLCSPLRFPLGHGRKTGFPTTAAVGHQAMVTEAANGVSHFSVNFCLIITAPHTLPHWLPQARRCTTACKTCAAMCQLVASSCLASLLRRRMPFPISFERGSQASQPWQMESFFSLESPGNADSQNNPAAEA